MQKTKSNGNGRSTNNSMGNGDGAWEQAITVMKNFLHLEEQESHEGENYDFEGVPMVCTPGFKIAFGDDTALIAFAALRKLKEKYPDGNLDYLAVYCFGDIKFWLISDAPHGSTDSDRHITFLLPEEY